ncbi:hypothetical protein [Kribbella sp. C-35]|uniref:hypothetical protein n=1 Tax=Kribbella sp. C-35 TaxID=2789276 RepID=UPI00397B57E1
MATSYGTNAERTAELAIELRKSMRAGSNFEQIQQYIEWCNKDTDFMLDLVEVMLDRYGWDAGRARRLDGLLIAANSAYRVRATDTSSAGLEERVAPGVKELVREAVDAAGGSAGDHLVNAWNAAYGRKPDAVKAYSEAIKAAEAALAPRVAPQNARQTLGTMIRDVSAKPAKWSFTLDDGSGGGVAAILQMMRTLWEGQTSRHGGLNPTRAETPDEARAAVHLATGLVQFGASGAFDLV